MQGLKPTLFQHTPCFTILLYIVTCEDAKKYVDDDVLHLVGTEALGLCFLFSSGLVFRGLFKQNY